MKRKRDTCLKWRPFGPTWHSLEWNHAPACDIPAERSTSERGHADEQPKLRDEMAHNTDLTQQSWGMANSMQYDISSIFRNLNLDPDQQY